MARGILEDQGDTEVSPPPSDRVSVGSVRATKENGLGQGCEAPGGV